MKLLVTGGCGFAGSHLVEEASRRGHQVTVLDCLTYAGQLRNVEHLRDLKIVHHDFKQPLPDLEADCVIHNGAESHVLRSLEDPGKFVGSNVRGTLNVLEWARTHGSRVVYVSTDEVFGPGGDEPFHEGDRLSPTNPYSASKAGGEFLARAYYRSFGVPVLITRTCNLFGERQHPEKFVPLAVNKILAREVLKVHAHEGVVGSRQWAYVGEQARALLWLAEHGDVGNAYHVSEGVVRSNLEMAESVAAILGVPLQHRLVEYAWSGHDLNYNLSARGTPERENWRLDESFTQSLIGTVLWYRDNPGWLG